MADAKFWIPFLQWDAFVADSPAEAGGDEDTDSDKRGIHGGIRITASLTKGDTRAIRALTTPPQLFALGEQEARLDDGRLKLTAQQAEFGLLGNCSVLDLPADVDLIYTFTPHHVTYNGGDRDLPSITVKAPLIPDDYDPEVDGPLVLNLAEMEWLNQSVSRGGGIIIRALPDDWEIDGDTYELRWFAQGEEIGQARTVPFNAIVGDELDVQVPGIVGAEVATVVPPAVDADIAGRQVTIAPAGGGHGRISIGGVPAGPSFPLSATTWSVVNDKPAVIAAGASQAVARAQIGATTPEYASAVAVDAENRAADRDAAVRLRALRAGASVWSNLLTDTHIHGGSIVGPLDRPVSVSGPAVVTPGAANLLAGVLPFAGFNVGTNGLPTGLSRQSGTAPKVLNAADGDSIDVTFTAAPGANFHGGIYISGFTPQNPGVYLLAFTLECVSATSARTRIRVGTYNQVQATTQEASIVMYGEERGPRRVVVRVDFTSVNQRFFFSVNDIDTNDTSARFRISNLMAIPETAALPVRNGLLVVPPYSQEATAASNITLNIPTAGDHMVLVKTVEAGWIVERKTLTAGANSLAGIFPGNSFTAQEIVAIPAAVWRAGDMDVIAPPEWKSVRFHNGANEGTSYPRSFADLAEMLGEPITPRPRQTMDRPYASSMGLQRTSLHRFEVRAGDRHISDVSAGNTNNRAELRHGLALPHNTDVWISFWTKIDQPVDDFAILMQIRQQENLSGDTSSLSPPFSFAANPGNVVRCVYRSDNGVPVLAGSGVPAGISSASTPNAEFVPGKWHACVFRVRVSDTGGGHLSWWWDGEEVFSSNVALGYDRDRGPLVHHGIYRAASELALSAHFDHLEISTEDLSSRIAAPLLGASPPPPPAVEPEAVTFTTTGATFNPTVALAPGSTATVNWAWTGGSTTGLNPTINFGSPATRTVTMTVLNGTTDAIGDVETINLGYNNSQDTGDYMVGAGHNKTPQAVTGVGNINAMTGLIRFLAATPDLAGALDFTGMTELEFIECFQANLTAVTLTGCTSLIRLCLEENALTTLDLNPVRTTLRDLRAANQAGDNLAFTALTGTLAQLYHFCVRDQTVTGHPTLAQMPALTQLWNWNCGQTGVLAVGGHATIQELRSYGNDYSSVTGLSASLQWIDLSGNDLDQADVDGIFTALNAHNTSGARRADLSNTAAPSAASAAARTAMASRGWTVVADAPAGPSWSYSNTFDTPRADWAAIAANEDFTAVTTNGGGATPTAVIAGGSLQKTSAGSYQVILTDGDGAAPADMSMTLTVAHADRNNGVSFAVLRYTGNDGVRVGYSGSPTFGRASDFNTDDSAGTADQPWPTAQWNTDQDHPVTVRANGPLIELLIHGVRVAYRNMTVNEDATGTQFGMGGGSANTYRSLTATAI